MHFTGYVQLWRPDHPLARADGYVFEHRYVLHAAGIAIPEGHHTHHKNGDKTDNRLENLEVVAAGEHPRIHMREVGVVTNQHGTFPLHTPETKRAKWREDARKHRERKRAAA